MDKRCWTPSSRRKCTRDGKACSHREETCCEGEESKCFNREEVDAAGVKMLRPQSLMMKVELEVLRRVRQHHPS
jgi:hypothetical protein